MNIFKTYVLKKKKNYKLNFPFTATNAQNRQRFFLGKLQIDSNMQLASFREQICKNHMRQNMGREKQKSSCFGIFLQKSPMSKL
jgi:hypothetical protein